MECELLQVMTAGSVDDGKSTLIGRLLHDSGGVYEDQVAAARRVSRNGLDLAFLTDGLRAEREQGITIDVAYRYFRSVRRRFIIADTPGHEQYTRNMATGASTAQLAVVLADARKGVLPQTKRHICIAWLLGIRRIVVAVNKMDLVEYREEVFHSIRGDFQPLIDRLGGCLVDFIPVSALAGDNVVKASRQMPWYRGMNLLEYLDTVPVDQRSSAPGCRLPVQSVLRAGEFRGYAGQIASGVLRPGDELIALPSGIRARVARLIVSGADVSRAFAPMCVCVELDRHIDAGRGDMFVSPEHLPNVGRRFRATLVWMSESPLVPGRPYLVKHTTQQVCAEAIEIASKTDIGTLEQRPAGELKLNEIGDAVLETHRPLFWDEYDTNRATGSLIVIDPITNLTVGAGMIRRAEVVSDQLRIRGDGNHPGLTVWFTGLSSAGKTTLSRAVYERLWARGIRVELLDGDDVRRHLCKGLGFSKEDRDENIRRIGFVAELLTRNGVVALVSAISPYRAIRDEIRSRIGNFVEVYVNAPLDVCEKRDVKGFYRKARAGELQSFTGVSDPYEPPLAPEIECRTDRETLAESVDNVLVVLGVLLNGR